MAIGECFGDFLCEWQRVEEVASLWTVDSQRRVLRGVRRGSGSMPIRFLRRQIHLDSAVPHVVQVALSTSPGTGRSGTGR